LPVEVQQEFQRITGGKLLEGYGLSESSPVAIASPMASGGRVGFIGVPFPDTDIKIVDQLTEEDVLGPDQAGILCLSGPQVMKGYWNKPAETEEVLRTDAAGKTWLHTGDVVAMAGDGYIRFVDRKKEVIIPPGGYNVYPREIEERLYEHPAVLEAAAIGVPMGDSAYQRIKVFVVLKEGESVTKSELIKWCRAGLAQYKVPKFVEFRTELPKTTIGKIFRRQLTEEEAGKMRRKETATQKEEAQPELERTPNP
jgi:long-chain acyl-CoA synthetase